MQMITHTVTPFSLKKNWEKKCYLFFYCMTQSLYWLPQTPCFLLLLKNQVFKGCWKNLTPIDLAIKLHFFMVCYFYCIWHCESRGQGPIKTSYQKLKESEFIPPSPLYAVAELTSHCLLFKTNFDPTRKKKKRNFTAFFISSDGKDSHALCLQCHKPHIHYINLISILQNIDPNI